ncbi:MAG: YunC family protein [Candidatus Hadarchaeum sp.]|uniref:YunC family protein n=1 Tax=Candidatus Hadarchaeum sp. TaxID=2883567 RepID=UPI003D0E5AB4
MIEIKELAVENKKIRGLVAGLPKAPLVALIAPKGYIMCGYLNLETAEKLGQAAAIVRGVDGIEDMLNKKISASTSQAKILGIIEGMSVKEALKKLL